MQFHAWKHMIRMIPYDSMHGTMTFRPSMQWKGMERKARIRDSQNFKFSFYLRVTFWKQLEIKWI